MSWFHVVNKNSGREYVYLYVRFLQKLIVDYLCGQNKYVLHNLRKDKK
jgi:hypothetical protein